MPSIKKLQQKIDRAIKRGIQRLKRRQSGSDSYCVGIDLGTTKTLVGYMSIAGSQKIEFINFTEDGDGPLPSVVVLEIPSAELGNSSILKAYLGEDILRDNRAFLRDKESLAALGIFPRAKLSIGKGSFDKDDYPEELLNRFPDVTAEDIIACILTKVRTSFKKQLDLDLFEATITVPASWDPEQRRATKMAAYMAGFKKVFLLEEPIAALLSVINIDQYKGLSENVMVVDFGGGTCDVAFVSIANDEILLKGIGAKNRLGGELIDEILLEEFIAKIKGDHKLAEQYFSNKDTYLKFQEDLKSLEDNAHIRSSLRRQFEIFKREINKEMTNRRNADPQKKGNATSSIIENRNASERAQKSMGENIRKLQSNDSDPAHDGAYSKPIALSNSIGSYYYTLEYDRFSALLKLPRPELPKDTTQTNAGLEDQLSVVNAFDALLKDVLEVYNPSNEKIDKVFLVGGSSYLYFIKERIHEKIFPKLTREQANTKILVRKNREDAVAQGATIYDCQRRNDSVNFKSKLFYNLQLEGDDSTLIQEDDFDINGYEAGGKLYTLKVKEEVPPEKPVRFRLIRSGGTISKKAIPKEIEHSMPIGPKRELQLNFRVTPDSIIFIEGKDFLSDEILKSIEMYPVIPEENLQEKIDSFKTRFANLFQ